MAQPPAAPPVPAPPPPPWTSSINVGLALTTGNNDSLNANGGFDVKYDPKTKNVFKTSGLFLYGETEGDKTAEQYGLNVRDEYALNPRTFVFGDFRYLHDRFKGIDYLVSPTAGVGYKILDRRRATLFVSGGVGGAWEQDTASRFRRSGAVTADQKLTVRLTRTASIGQSLYALWNVTDVHDELYVFRANVTAALAGRMQLKLEVADTYKTKLPPTTRQNNDVAVIASVVYRF